MAQSIKFNDNVFLDASAVDGIKGTIYDGDNLNNYTGKHNAGSYYVDGASVTNSPGVHGALIVIPIGSSGCHQIFYTLGGMQYHRTYAGNPIVWSAWHPIKALQEQIFNTTSMSTTSASGTVSTSIYDFNQICFTIAAGTYKTMYILPRAEIGTGNMIFCLYYSPSWNMSVEVRFSSGTEFTYIVRNLTGWTNSDTLRLTIFGMS